MLDSSEYVGSWWLPENPENKVHGKLNYERGKRAILSLDGALHENLDDRDQGEFYGIILGDSHGKRITLRNCIRTNLEMVRVHDSSEEYAKSEFDVFVFYIGHYFAKEEDIKFTILYVRYSELEEWLGERLFHSENGETEEGLYEHTVKFTQPKSKAILLDKFKISIEYGLSTARHANKTEMKANAKMSIDAIDEIHIDQFFSAVHHMRNFLSLATGNAVSILSLTGENKEVDYYEPVQIFYREDLSNERLFSKPFFPFDYKSISERPEFYLQNWFNLVDNLKPTYDLYFGTIYNPYLYPTHEFLSLAQALESYCSKNVDNDIMPEDLFEETLSKMLEIVNVLPRPYRQQIRPKAQYGMNRKSLRTKLKELFQKHGNLFRSFIPDKNEFIGKVVDTRNYYTHYSPELEEKAVKIIDIPFLSQKLRYVLIAILLKEIGFDNGLIDHALRMYMRFGIRPIS